ncbi:HAD-IA family hydrolase [Streptomyces carpaticus]|uniref:HAD-IA family hydrolase n=1 Tax=Streptomyces carpaticus TaxID=285558 RepID=A0ABV4ZMP9_9ACTN
MTAPPLRVAVAGLGWAATSIWLPRLAAHPAFTVTALADPDPDRVTDALPLAPAARPLGDAGDIRRDDTDLTVVAVPNHLHAPVAGALLARGISVFVEKPVCRDQREAAALADAEAAGGSVLLAGSAARQRADIGALAALLPKLGRIRHIDLSWVRAAGVPDAGGWFTQRAHSGGGSLVDLGWHLLDILPVLLGPTEITQVSGAVSGDFLTSGAGNAAWRGTGPDQEPPGAAGDVEDTARGFLVTTEGVSVSLRTSWASHEERDVTLVRVDGSEGSATLRCTFGFSPNRVRRPTLTLAQGGLLTPLPLDREPVGAEYDRQLDDIARQLAEPDRARGRAIEETRRNVSVIERFYASALPTRADNGWPAGGAARTGVEGTESPAAAERRPAPQRARPERDRIRAVVFDLDGVLVDSFPVMREAFSIAYAEVVGPEPAPFEEYSRHLGRYFPDIMRIMGLPPEMEGPFVRESYRLASRVPLFDGVPALLGELAARDIPMAVATGKSGPRARSLLDGLGILDRFVTVIGSDEVPRAKPAPDIVELALSRLQVPARHAVVIGDAITDLASARAAGAGAVAALWADIDEGPMLAAAPDAVLRQPDELLDLLGPLALPLATP